MTELKLLTPLHVAAIAALAVAVYAVYIATRSSRADREPLLVAFVTPHCPHCQSCKDEINRYPGPCRVIDVADQRDEDGTALAEQLRVQGVPSFFFQTDVDVFHAVPADAPRTAGTWSALAKKLNG